MLSNELFMWSITNSLSEEGLHEVIERHELIPKIPLSKYQFFFAACLHKRVTEGIIKCLLQHFPEAASATDDDGWSPLHCACSNINVTPGILQLLIDAAPDSIRHADNEGRLPLHQFCMKDGRNEITALEILNLLLEKHPEAVRSANNKGDLPIHVATMMVRSPEFCHVLIQAYPGSERLTNNLGMLPFHRACMHNTVAVVEYLYKLYPDAINHATTEGAYPIIFAMGGKDDNRNSLTGAVRIVQFLLNLDPNVARQKIDGFCLPLLWAIHLKCNDSNVKALIEIIKMIYDAHPEAIYNEDVLANLEHGHRQVRAFLDTQMFYSWQARFHRLMATPNYYGQLPLHTAVQNNDAATPGSFKLLVKGNPSAVQSPDNEGALPSHVACQHHDSVSVVEYLLGLDATTLYAVDTNGDTPLHCACRGAKFETITMILEKYDAVSVSKRNAQKKLPIELLWESDEVLDRKSIEYTEIVSQLLKAYPETWMSIGS
ncbi:ankyrin repeat domain-containing protein [Skeletonema marinoi]|uniref:Ankyrin repeat domain-containing protein n=1 Tax=Skeletonema marinoi TaxID=267567 RepID=A0AAD8XUZ5_9STRA|nr:ankyrin repeat domain-containing protein [Skeletonema marinoi]